MVPWTLCDPCARFSAHIPSMSEYVPVVWLFWKMIYERLAPLLNDERLYMEDSGICMSWKKHPVESWLCLPSKNTIYLLSKPPNVIYTTKDRKTKEKKKKIEKPNWCYYESILLLLYRLISNSVYKDYFFIPPPVDPYTMTPIEFQPPRCCCEFSLKNIVLFNLMQYLYYLLHAARVSAWNFPSEIIRISYIFRWWGQ